MIFMVSKNRLVIFAIAVSLLTVLVTSQAIDLSPYLSASTRYPYDQIKTIRPTDTDYNEGIYIFVESNGATIVGPGPHDSIECITYEDFVETPREASTGYATGRRQYDPVKITKRIDKTSPLMHSALSNNENMEITISFYKITKIDPEEYYTIKLMNAKLASIKTSYVEIPNGKTELLEEYSFVFQSIEWTYVEDGITFSDSWSNE